MSFLSSAFVMTFGDCPVRQQEIRTWVDSLVRSFGEPRRNVDDGALRTLYDRKDYPGMVSAVKTLMRLETLRVKFRIIRRTSESAPLWLELPRPMPAYGSLAFRQTSVTLSVQRSFIDEAPFEILIAGLAHEMSHAITRAVGQEYAYVEEAVDLTAMLLGFKSFFLKSARIADQDNELARELLGMFTKTLDPKFHKETVEGLAKAESRIGYLTQDEVRYAARLMQT